MLWGTKLIGHHHLLNMIGNHQMLPSQIYVEVHRLKPILRYKWMLYKTWVWLLIQDVLHVLYDHQNRTWMFHKNGEWFVAQTKLGIREKSALAKAPLRLDLLWAEPDSTLCGHWNPKFVGSNRSNHMLKSMLFAVFVTGSVPVFARYINHIPPIFWLKSTTDAGILSSRPCQGPRASAWPWSYLGGSNDWYLRESLQETPPDIGLSCQAVPFNQFCQAVIQWL